MIGRGGSAYPLAGMGGMNAKGHGVTKIQHLSARGMVGTCR